MRARSTRVLTPVHRRGALGHLGFLLHGRLGCRHRRGRQVAGAAAAVAAARDGAAQVGARLIHQEARRLERELVLRMNKHTFTH
jgi:hypothetical protein